MSFFYTRENLFLNVQSIKHHIMSLQTDDDAQKCFLT
jgi:hypothetical protein